MTDSFARFRRLLVLATACCGLATAAAAAEPRQTDIALTFDDLPGLTIESDQRYVDAFNISLLDGLRRHRIPAIGFVNEGKLDELNRAAQIANLKRWLDAGMVLGNHTYSHSSPNQIGVTAYIADIRRGEPVIRELMSQHGLKLQWFRHPYLETGYPASAKRQIDDWLGSNGYRIAPVTIDADDWEFAEPYDDAVVHHDLKRQKSIRAQYLAYTATRIDWSIRSAHILFGRDISQVMLLHCTRLNADSLNELVRILRRFHLKPVSLAQAMADSVYRTPDRYVSKDGVTWLERWASDMRKDLPVAGDEDPPASIEAAYDRVDNDRR